MIYLGSYTRRHSKGIYQLKDNNISLFLEAENPTYVTQTKDYVYSIFGGQQGSGIIVYDKDKQEVTQKVHSDEKSGPCHIHVNEQENLIVTCNYHEHAFHVYRKVNGLWQEPMKVETFNIESKIHYSYYSTINETLYVVDLGLDKIYLYHLDKLSEPYQELLFPKGSGVRHCVFSKDDQMMYVLSEYSGEIFVYNNHKMVAQIKTDPNHQYNEGGAAIRLNHNEQFLAVSLRTKNQIVIYRVDGNQLVEFQRLSSGGEHPRDFDFIDENTILCANRDSDNIVFFKAHEQTQKYIQTETLDAPEIVCISV